MASVSLSTVWLTDASTPSDSVQVTATAIVDSPAVNGQVMVYANGRLRSITTAGTPRQVSLTITLADPTTIAWMEARMGLPVLVRDPFGLKRYCVFYGWDRSQAPYGPYSDLPVKLYEITFSEAV